MNRAARALTLVSTLALVAGCSTISNTASNLWPFGRDNKGEAIKEDDGRISILSFDQALTADPAIAALPITLPPPAVNTSWASPGGPGTNAPGHAAASGSLSIVWKRNAGAGATKKRALVAPPIVADGRVYILDANNSVRAVDAQSGSALWNTSIEPPRTRRRDDAMGGGLTFDNGQLFVTTGFGEILALDPATGSVTWRHKSPAPYHSAPAASDGRVFAVSNDAEMVALNASGGSVSWNFQAIPEPARVLSSPSAAVLGDVVVMPFASGEIVALLASNGRRLWADALTRAGTLTSLGTINDIAGRPVIFDNKVYAVSQSGIIAAIDLRSGTRLWARTLASIQTPLVAGDFIYVVSTAGELVCLTRSTGSVRWVSELARYEKPKDKKDLISWTGPILAGGRLVLANSVGAIVTVDPLTGETLTTQKAGAPVYIAPVIANETVYVLNDKAELIALR